jgi:hypothetical protein
MAGSIYIENVRLIIRACSQINARVVYGADGKRNSIAACKNVLRGMTMKRSTIKKLSLLSAFVMLATLPYLVPAIESERVSIERRDHYHGKE